MPWWIQIFFIIGAFTLGALGAWYLSKLPQRRPKRTGRHHKG